MKCSRCKKTIKKGKKAYFGGKVVCQHCFYVLSWRAKLKRNGKKSIMILGSDYGV